MTNTIDTTTQPSHTFRIHDGIYDPAELIKHCNRMLAEIAERQKHLIDFPV